MAITVTCSGCEKVYKLNDALDGKKVRCKSCQQIIVVRAASSRAGDGPPKKRPRGEDAASPKAKLKRSSNKRSEDDRKDAWPRLVWIVGGGAGLFLVVGLSVGGFFLFRSEPPAPQVVQVADLDPAKAFPDAPNVPKTFDKPKPAPAPIKAPAPAPAPLKAPTSKPEPVTPAPTPIVKPPGAPGTKNELDGLWHRVKVEAVLGGGPPANSSFRMGEAAFIEGERFNGGAGWIIRIDPQSTPKTIDFKIGSSTYLGIYKLEDDQLSFATHFSVESRPDSFSVKDPSPGRPVAVYVFKFVPENAEDAAARLLPKLDPKAQALDGFWALEEAEENAPYPYPWEEAIYFDGDSWILAKKDGWRGLMGGVCKTNPNAMPPTVDVKIEKGELRGIYAIEGDRLTIALNGTGGDRPSVFSTKLTAGRGRAAFLRRYRRVHPTKEIAWLKQTGRLDPAKQVLDGLWLVAHHREDVAFGPPRIQVHQAVYFEKGKWHSASKDGRLVPPQVTYDYRADPSQPLPTIEMKGYGDVKLRGIYKVEGDVLYFATNCNDVLPKYFTTNLTAGPGRARFVIVLKRDGKSDAAPVVDEVSPEVIMPRTISELNGLWILEKGDDSPGAKVRWPQQDNAIFIEDGRYRFATKDGRFVAMTNLRVKADPSKDPKWFDFKGDHFHWRCIYKIEGDVLTIATNFQSDARPTSFSEGKLEAGGALHVRTYRRAKDTTEGAKLAAPLDPKTQLLSGSWKLQNQDGDGHWPWLSQNVYFEDDTAYFLPAVNRVTLRIDRKATPPSIDLTWLAKTYRGIYKIEGDRLTIALVGEETARPSLFTTKLASGTDRAHHIWVYVRAEPSAEASKAKEFVKGLSEKIDRPKQNLEGVWDVEHMVEWSLPFGQGFSGSIAFEDGKWRRPGFEGRYTCDPQAPIPTIDLTGRDNETFRGIFLVQGNKLYLTFGSGIEKRPQLFTHDVTAGPGRGSFNAILKRRVDHPNTQKAKELAKGVTGTLDPAKQKLDGLWIVEHQVGLLSSSGPSDFGDAIAIQNGTWQSVRKSNGKNVGRQYQYVIDPITSLTVIDLKNGANEVARGIFVVDGDLLYFASTSGGADRPRLFTTDANKGPGRASFYAILRRER